MRDITTYPEGFKNLVAELDLKQGDEHANEEYLWALIDFIVRN